MDNIWKTSDEKAISFLNKAVILGLDIKELKTNCDNYCYLIKKAHNSHVIYIPNEVKHPKRINSQFENELITIRGELQVIGGSSIQRADRLFSDVKLKLLDLRKFNTSKCVSMRGMFMYGYINEILFGENWNTSSVSDMQDMFKFMNSDMRNITRDEILLSLNVNNWNMQNVIDMQYMFFASTFKNLDINEWEIRTDCIIKGIFDDIKVDTLDLRGFNLRETFDDDDFVSNAEIEKLIVNLDDYNNYEVRDKLQKIKKCNKLDII